MNFKHIIASLLIAGSALTGCKIVEDNIYDELPSKRADKIAAEYNAVLCSAENGWAMEYYPSSYDTYGGFNVVCKFNADGTVTVAADYSTSEFGTYSATSFYKMRQDDGVTLTFDTYNEVMHFLSDPSSDEGAGNGKGFEGDFDFNIISCTSEQVVLKGTKTGSTAVLVPLKNSADEYLAAVHATKMKVAKGNYVRAILNGEDIDVDLNYNRFDVAYTNEKGVYTEIAMPFVYTNRGIKLKEPVNFAGHEIKEFAINEEGAFENSEIGLTVMPFVPDLDIFETVGSWYVDYDKATKVIQQYFAAGYTLFQESGLDIGYMTFGPLQPGYYALDFVYTKDGEPAGKGSFYYTKKTVSGIESIINTTLYSYDSDETGTLYSKYGFNYITNPFGSTKGAYHEVAVDDLENPTLAQLYNLTTGEYMLLTKEMKTFPFASLNVPAEEEEEEGEGE